MSRLAGSRTGRRAAAVWAAFAGGAVAGFAGVAGPACAAALLVGAGGLLVAGAVRGRRVPAWVAAAVLLALALGTLRGAAAVERAGPGRIDGHLGSRPVAVIGVVRDTAPGGGGPVIVDTRSISDADTEARISGGILVSGPNVPAVSPGDTVEIDATGIRSPNLRPGPESLATLEREDVEAVAVAPLVSIRSHGGPSLPRAIAGVQGALVAGVDRILPEPQAALTLGIAFGIRRPLAGEVRAPLQDAGLIHIVVVSGLKVVMLLGIVGAAASALGWSPRRRLLLALAAAAVYVLLSGAGPAAIRSALMAGSGLVAGTAGRRTDPLPMLALSAALMLGIDPALVRDPGFQLSFLGTAGIVLLARPLGHRIPGPRLLVEPFAVTVAAQAATVPVMAGTFGVLALLGPVANALVLPLLPPLIVIGGAGALVGTVLPFLGWAMLQVAGLGAGLILLVARAAAAVPGAAIQVGQWPLAWTIAEIAGLGCACAVGVLAARGRSRSPAVSGPPPAASAPGRGGRRRWAALAAVAGVLGASAAGYAASRPDGRMHVIVLSTGAAPAVLIRGDDGGLALVDGGSSPSTLVQALGRVLSPADHRIDLVVVTGGEQAAVAGLSGLAGRYQVGTVVASRRLNPGGVNVVEALQSAGAAAVDPAGRDWSWGGAVWRCLPFEAQATGRAMFAVAVDDPSGRVLVLGDAGTADQEELAALYPSSLPADVVVSEPGGSLSTVLLGLARPRAIAVPTVQGGYAAAAPQGYAVLRTGAQGDLQFDGGPGGLVQAA